MDFLLSPTEEHAMLRRTMRSFVAKHVEPQAAQFNREERWNKELFLRLASLGVLGVTVDPAYGGAGLDPLAAVIVHEELSFSDPGFCLAYLAHAMLCTNNLAVNGSEEQKKRFLPKLCAGEFIGAMGMSETGAGTDVLGMKTSAVKKENTWVLDGQKMWITNASCGIRGELCDLVLVYANTSTDPKARAEISSFLVESGTKGFNLGQRIHGKLGMRSSETAELCFDRCELPESALMGIQGGSLVHMMHNLEIERLTLAAMGLGIARRCLEVMRAYANERVAFGKVLSSFGQIQAMLAESFAEYQAARCYVYATAQSLGNAGGRRVDSDGVKLIAAPAAKRIADRAIQVLGGNGYIEEYVVERMWRDAKLLEIGGGTIESHQKNISKDLRAELAID